MRNDITEEKIYEVMRNIIREKNNDICYSKLIELTSRKFNCGGGTIKKKCGGTNNIITKFNIPKFYFSSITKENISEGHKRQDISKDLIYETINKIYNLNKDVSQTKLLHLTSKELNCGCGLIYRICGTKEEIFNELNINIPKSFINSEAKKNVSEGIRNSDKFKKYIRERPNNLKYIKNMSEGHMRKDITKEKVHKIVEEIVNIYGIDISIEKFKDLLCKILNCSWTPIKRVCGSIDTILDETNIKITKIKEWKKKENLGIELCKELYGEGRMHKRFHNLKSKPDFTPNNVLKPIVDIKSTTGDIRIEQNNKYEQIRKDVRFMVFENVGKTELPSDRIIYMKEIIKSLPNNKRLIFQEKFERIKNNVPLEQMDLKDFKEKNK